MFEKRNMKFQRIEKRKFTVLTPKGPPFGKKFKKFQKIVFFQRFLFFQLKSEFYMFLALFCAK